MILHSLSTDISSLAHKKLHENLYIFFIRGILVSTDEKKILWSSDRSWKRFQEKNAFKSTSTHAWMLSKYFYVLNLQYYPIHDLFNYLKLLQWRAPFNGSETMAMQGKLRNFHSKYYFASLLSADTFQILCTLSVLACFYWIHSTVK